MVRDRRRVNLSLSPAELEKVRAAAGSMPTARWVAWAALTMAEAVTAAVSAECVAKGDG